MPSNLIYKDGGLAVDITVPAGEKIAVYSRSRVQIYQKTGYSNQPTSTTLLTTVAADTQYVSSAFSSGATLQLVANASEVLYAVGTTPVVTELKGYRLQEAPTALNATGTLTAAAIASGIVTSTTAAAVAATLDTGAITDTALDLDIGDSFDWSVINTGGANAFTVTASAGHTVVGAGAVANSTSGLFRTRKTAASTFVTYRIG